VGPCYGLAASYTRIGKERVHVTTLTQSPSSGKRLGPRCTGGREKAGVVRWRTSMALLSSLVPSTLPRSPSLSIPPRQHHRRLQARSQSERHIPRARIQDGERRHVGLRDTSGCAPQNLLDRRFALDAPQLRPNTRCQQLGAGGDIPIPAGDPDSGALDYWPAVAARTETQQLWLCTSANRP
jgi:hypothetical protein